MQLSNKPKTAQSKTLLLLLLPAVLLMGCASNSPVCPVESQPLPTAPSVSTPAPPQPYSESASQNIKRWEQRLMGTQMMRD